MRKSLLFVCLLVCISRASVAALVSFDVTGFVTSVIGDIGYFGYAQPGDAFQVRYSFDTGTYSFSQPFSYPSALYQFSPSETVFMDITLNSLTLSLKAGLDIWIHNPDPAYPGGGTDAYIVQAAGVRELATLGLYDPTRTAMDGIMLPMTPPDLSSFSSRSFELQIYGNILSGAVQTITAAPVPVPAAVWLFGSGLLGLIGVARKNRLIQFT